MGSAPRKARCLGGKELFLLEDRDMGGHASKRVGCPLQIQSLQVNSKSQDPNAHLSIPKPETSSVYCRVPHSVFSQPQQIGEVRHLETHFTHAKVKDLVKIDLCKQNHFIYETANGITGLIFISIAQDTNQCSHLV